MGHGPTSFKASKSAIAEGLLYLDGKKFSFENHPFHRAIYDGYYPVLLKKTSRQIGKTLSKNSMLPTANGYRLPAYKVTLGTKLLSLDLSTERIVPAAVTGITPVYTKAGVRITTAQGHVLELGDTHPVRVWDGWKPAGQLTVGERVAAARRGGVFTGSATHISKERLRLTAYMLGDGCCGGMSEGGNYLGYSFTSMPGPKLEEFKQDLGTCGIGYTLAPTDSKAFQLQMRKGIFHVWSRADGLDGARSATKFIPEWAFNLSKEDTALFLNRLWSTDGCVVIRREAEYDIRYGSISRRLIHDVQALLWKFGIPSTISKHNPTIYQRRDEVKWAYTLAVRTHEGFRNFLDEVGALEKSENILPPEEAGYNTKDSVPIGIQSIISRIIASRPTKPPRGEGKSLWNYGLHATLVHNPSHEKLQEYVDFFRRDPLYDQSIVDELEMHMRSDVYWDRVLRVELLGEIECIDFEVPSTQNFLVEGIVTHNSTLCSNFMIAESVAVPFFKTLYVSPTKEQTSKFSNTRLSKTLNYSPLIHRRFCGYEDTDNVFLKVLANGSEISLSYASDDPDRIRGISADRILLDEVQDMDVTAVLPVVKECASASDFAYETFCGTPKGMENGIEYLWQNSTQTVWIMPCSGCGKFNYIDSENSIGLKGPICIKCGHLLNPRDGQWYDLNPGARTKGFHISQPMLPQNAENPARWERILDKKENYAPSKFKNEVLGVSDAIGTRMLSLEELQSLCQDYVIEPIPKPGMMQYRIICGGVDWSGGGAQALSRTVCWVWGLMPDDRVKCLYYRIFPGRNQVEDVREVANVFNTYRCQFVCGDAGEGAVANAMLKEMLGEHRVLQLQYGSVAKHVTWNGRDRYMIDKTGFIDSYMLMLKRKGVVFANVKQMTPAINDILNEFEEVTQNGMGRKVWRHAPTQPDDALHAGLFAWVAIRIARGELQLYKTTVE